MAVTSETRHPLTEGVSQVRNNCHRSRDLKGYDLWVTGAFLLGLVPMLPFIAIALWALPQMRFAPLVLVAVAWLVYREGRNQETQQPARWWSATIALILASVSYLLAMVQLSPWLAQLAAILIFFAWALGRCGNTSWHMVTAWTGMLMTTLVPPFDWTGTFTERMHLASSWASSKALDALGISNFRQGNLLHLRDYPLFMDRICSGLGNIYSLFAIAILFLILNRRSFAVSLLLLFTVPLWSVFHDFLQIMSIGLSHEYFGWDLSRGIDNWVLSIGTFTCTVACYWLTEKFIAAMLAPVPPAEPQFSPIFRTYNKLLVWPYGDVFDESVPWDDVADTVTSSSVETEQIAPHDRSPMHWITSRLITSVVQCCGLIFMLVGCVLTLAIARSGPSSMAAIRPTIAENQLVDIPNRDSLPAQVGLWNRIGFEHARHPIGSPLGQHSLTWKYLWKDQIVWVSLDFPFERWMSVSPGYKSSGWQIDSERIPQSESTDKEWAWEELEMTNDFGGRGYAYCCAFSSNQRLCDGAPSGGTNAYSCGLATRITEAFREADTAPPLIFQIRLFFESGHPLTKERRDELTQQFHAFRSLILSASTPYITNLAGH
jgi:hypothetical protein